jgi:hypothetical protein
LIAERTKAGLRSAKARGRVGGNPGLRARDPGTIRKLRSARDAVHLDAMLAGLDAWLPTVRRMRPDQPWGDVVQVLNRRGGGQAWTAQRLRRAVHRPASEGIVEPGSARECQAQASRRPAGRGGGRHCHGRAGDDAAAGRHPT